MVLFKEDEADSISKDFGNTSELWLPPQVYFQEQNQGGLFSFSKNKPHLWQYHHARVALGPRPFLEPKRMALGESNLETVGVSWCLGWLSTSYNLQ